MSNPWTDAEIMLIRALYLDGKRPAEIATILGRTIASTRNKAYKLKITDTSDNWTDAQKTYLVENYKSYNLVELSIVLRKHKTNVCRKARELGITRSARKREILKAYHDTSTRWTNNTGHKLSELELHEKRVAMMREWCDNHPDHGAVVSARQKEWLKTHEHPRGMLGKKHGDNFKRGASKRLRAQWADPNSSRNSDINRERMSDQMVANRKANPQKYRCGYSRGRQGKRDDLNGLYVRSSWEANYARYLNFLIGKKEIFKWEYEPDTFWFEAIKRGTRSYLPDFKIWEQEDSTPYYVEVKGWMDEKSKTKLSRMAKYYPDVKIVLFQSSEYKELKKWSNLISGWE